jgi:CspA family cold shock protein
MMSRSSRSAREKIMTTGNVQAQDAKVNSIAKVCGKVKWFNNAKGYGFIVADGGNEDIFAHYSSITMEGYKTLKAGQSVMFDTKEVENGIHAVNISAVEEMIEA